jgi:hypothetical protein
MNERAPPARRDEFPHHSPITTRWADNDAFGHIKTLTRWCDTTDIGARV